MSNSFTNQVLAQIELYTKTAQYPLAFMCCPSIRRKVARLHLGALGVTTELDSNKPTAWDYR